ncbi:MAG TPA: Asp23/Gls24 family envelope stress response protein [Streptosporangiaceae bacterium]
MTAATALRPGAPGSRAGRTELGMISIDDRVVEKMASCAVAEIPDAGGAAPRILGRSMPGAGVFGTRRTSLTALPKVSADVDGSIVVLELSISVRWPASVPEVSSAVREHVRSRVSDLTGLTVTEIAISVTDLVTRLPGPPRVR